jgi:hypothetical protein
MVGNIDQDEYIGDLADQKEQVIVSKEQSIENIATSQKYIREMIKYCGFTPERTTIRYF